MTSWFLVSFKACYWFACLHFLVGSGATATVILDRPTTLVILTLLYWPDNLVLGSAMLEAIWLPQQCAEVIKVMPSGILASVGARVWTWGLEHARVMPDCFSLTPCMSPLFCFLGVKPGGAVILEVLRGSNLGFLHAKHELQLTSMLKCLYFYLVCVLLGVGELGHTQQNA